MRGLSKTDSNVCACVGWEHRHSLISIFGRGEGRESSSRAKGATCGGEGQILCLPKAWVEVVGMGREWLRSLNMGSRHSLVGHQAGQDGSDWELPPFNGCVICVAPVPSGHVSTS